MNNELLPLSKDDVFLLGNISYIAVSSGDGDKVLPIIRLIQEERPENAGSIVLEAMHLFMQGKIQDAIKFIEDSEIFNAEKNRDEAIAFHLFLLQQAGSFEQVVEFGQIYLNEGMITSESALETVRAVTSECQAKLKSN